MKNPLELVIVEKDKEIELLKKKLDVVENELSLYKTRIQPGHYYSPIPNSEEVKSRAGEIFDRSCRMFEDIDLNVEGQFSYIEAFAPFAEEMPFTPEPKEHMRYAYTNNWVDGPEGALIYFFMRHLKPKNIIEIGSGYSSAFIMDTNELFFDWKISCTFVEPYPQRLLELFKEGDRERVTVFEQQIQTVDTAIFSALEANDILYIDCSHVSKVGSDVNFIFFEILPRLKSGVYVHFHDVFYPFEYPDFWIFNEEIYWNELYLLRAFLQYNKTYRIEFFHHYLQQCHSEKLLSALPDLYWGQNIWLKKTD